MSLSIYFFTFLLIIKANIPIKLIQEPSFKPLGIYLNSITCFPLETSKPINVSKTLVYSTLDPSTKTLNPLS